MFPPFTFTPLLWIKLTNGSTKGENTYLYFTPLLLWTIEALILEESKHEVWPNGFFFKVPVHLMSFSLDSLPNQVTHNLKKIIIFLCGSSKGSSQYSIYFCLLYDSRCHDISIMCFSYFPFFVDTFFLLHAAFSSLHRIWSSWITIHVLISLKLAEVTYASTVSHWRYFHRLSIGLRRYCFP